MDIAIKKKQGSFLKRYSIIILLLIPLFIILKYLVFLGESDFSVDKNSIVTAKVINDRFSVSVRGSGILIPENIQWLSSSVEAKVEKLIVKAGNIVKEGDLIVKLSNPRLLQELAEIKWELEAMLQESKASRMAQEIELIEHKSLIQSVIFDYEKSVNEYNAHEELIVTHAVSKLNYQRTRIERDQNKQRLISIKEQHTKLEENLLIQNEARAARINQTRNKLERIQQQVNNLEIKATMDSIVLEVPVELGQRVVMGANIAKLAQQNSLIAELQVPEIQIRNIEVGQSVIIDTRNNKIMGTVSRIDPAVINGNVLVDVSLSGKMPDDARPDLSIDGEIQVTEIDNTLYVNRPIFSQSNSEAALYKLNDDGDIAERVNVKLGYGSVNQIQIIEGLKAGDIIIISDPSRFEIYNKFRIK
ncbi:efflux RND transporter periplasmic adaptor subunit [Colwelliaceae bacterium 6441]